MTVLIGVIVLPLFVVMSTSAAMRGIAEATPRGSPTSRVAAILLAGRHGWASWIWVAAFAGCLAAWLKLRGEVIPVSAVVVLPSCFAALASLIAEQVTRVGLRRAHDCDHTPSDRATPSTTVQALVIVGAGGIIWLILDLWLRIGGV